MSVQVPVPWTAGAKVVVVVIAVLIVQLNSFHILIITIITIIRTTTLRLRTESGTIITRNYNGFIIPMVTPILHPSHNHHNSINGSKVKRNGIKRGSFTNITNPCWIITWERNGKKKKTRWWSKKTMTTVGIPAAVRTAATSPLLRHHHQRLPPPNNKKQWQKNT